MSEGLREQKKRATRAAIHRQALEIAHAEGIASATVDRIAEAAGVSPRTFFNYYPSKEDALSGADPDLPLRLAEALRNRPADEPLADALRAVIVEQMSAVTQDPELWRLRRVVADQSPTLAASVLGSGAAASRALAHAAYERTGTDVTSDPVPAVQTFTTIGVLRAAMWLYAERGFRGDVGDVVETAYETFRTTKG